jgi:uncharacterized membrane protein YfcA
MEAGLYSSVVALAFICELIDASLGMMYGTLLSPILIIMGFDARIVVPSILLSQAAGGLIGTVRHNGYGHADFSGMTRDMKIVLVVVLPGLLACAVGALVGVKISKFALDMYIAVLVILMGVLCVRPYYYKFGWWKMVGIGLLASFNKAMSGGGFGPVTSSGKILGGIDSKTSIATTTFAEIPICLAGFIIWFILNKDFDWELPVPLLIGSFAGGLLGPWITKRIHDGKLRITIGILAIISGIWIVVKLFL